MKIWGVIVALCLCGCSATVPSNPNHTEAAVSLAVVAPSATIKFSLTPTNTPFDLYASPSVDRSKSNYVFVAHATNELWMLVSAFDYLSNSPSYSITLEWTPGTNHVAGYRIYIGDDSNLLVRAWQGRSTNAAFSWPDGRVHYYAATSYSGTNESLYSNIIASGTAPKDAPYRALFFCASTPTPINTKLKIELQ